MKKIILTCLLGGLCLFGSNLKANNTVVDSPREVPLHSSVRQVSTYSGDTHRSGETRSDNFAPLNFGLKSIGLLNLEDHKKIQKMHESAMFGSPLISLRYQIQNQKQEIISLTNNLPSGFSLVDNANPQGQEESNPSAQEGRLLNSFRSEENYNFIQYREIKLPDTLKIGDPLPAGLEVGPVLHHSEKKIRLDDYRGKYLLLMFWSPTCSGSIGTLPKIDQLASKYKEQLEVVPITIFPQERVLEVSEAYPSFQNLSLPIATEASYLRTLFPHTRIPHMVLVDPAGKIEAITGSEDITEENLEMLFQTGSGNFRTKVDRRIFLNPGEKLISENTHLVNKNIWLQSAMTGYIPDVGGSLIQNFDGFSHIRITNMTPIYMFQLAYSERNLVDYYGLNRIKTVGFDQDELISDKSGADALAWMEEGNHVFGYELIAPPSYNPYQMMREDLKRYFPHIEVTLETQTMKVMALVQQPDRVYPRSENKPKSYKFSPMGVAMTNYPLQGFVYHLNAAFWKARPTPIVNLTAIDYPIDLKLEAPLGNYEKLREALQKNGFDLIEREEEIKILVLKKIAPFKTLIP